MDLVDLDFVGEEIGDGDDCVVAAADEGVETIATRSSIGSGGSGDGGTKSDRGIAAFCSGKGRETKNSQRKEKNKSSK